MSSCFPAAGPCTWWIPLGKNKQLTYICNLHEQACAIAADAYSQYTNSLGVALGNNRTRRDQYSDRSRCGLA